MAVMSRENAKLVGVAAFCTVVSLAGPSVAHGVQHAVFAHQAGKAVRADKVDGKHAVGASAAASKRAKKLVATDGKGRLPDDIIAQAPDAAQLDGRDAGAYTTYWLAVRANGTIRSRSAGLEGATVSKIAGNGRYCVFLPDGLPVRTEAVVGSIQETIGGTQRYSLAVTGAPAGFAHACAVAGDWDVAVLTQINESAADGAFTLLIPGTPASAG